MIHNSNVVACLEHPLYRQYIEEEFAACDTPIISVDKAGLAEALAENGSGVLLLQSDEAEPSMIVLSSKIKRLFGEEFSVILFSSDYQTAEECGASVDAFLQYPASIDQIRTAISSLADRKRRILIIDDSKLVHNHLTPLLHEQGYEIHNAFDGAQGLEMANEMKPDLIICDIEMPNMNGFEACSVIRQTAEIADTYIIMSSTLGSAADQQQGFSCGVDEYITKPVVVSELLDRIKKVFQASGSGRENILVLENDDGIARNLTTSLTKQGFSARVSRTIREAIRTLKRLNYDLVICEINLSDGSMLDLIGALESLDDEFQPDVLVLTSRESHADEKMVINAGAAGVISKPFTMDSLLASVERALADRRARQEKDQLSKYVSKASMRMALEKSIMSGKLATTRAYRKQASIFFSDVVGFTSRCERYAPKEMVDQINGMFEMMTRVIMEHDGDIDKFIGDACMAFWLDDDPQVSAQRAVSALLRIREELAAMNKADAVLSADPIEIRVGINTGEIILCDLGAADARIDLTIIGDPVNIAARFESGAKQYGVNNLIGQATLAPCLDRYAARMIDLVRVKGKDEAVGCYELFGTVEKVTLKEQNLIADFNRGIEAFRSGDFEQALSIFQKTSELEKVQTAGEINPSRLYQQRCQQLNENPPADWDGAWTLTSK